MLVNMTPEGAVVAERALAEAARVAVGAVVVVVWKEEVRALGIKGWVVVAGMARVQKGTAAAVGRVQMALTLAVA